MIPCTVLGERTFGLSALREHPDELLGIEGIAAGALEQRALRLGAERCQQLRCLFVGEGRKRDTRGVRLPSAPRGPALEQLGPRGAHDQQRDVAHPLGEMLHEIEQAVVGPLDVLEHEHERALLGHRLEEAPPRGEGLLLRAGRVALADERPQCDEHPVPSSSTAARPAGSSFASPPRRVGLEDAACAFTISRAPSS
jgi:hypothetical protein